MITGIGSALQLESIHYDICIIGSGPAGATIANILADTPFKLCVLESGKYAPDPFGNALREVTSEGISIKPNSRERVVGGTSTTWTGISSPLDRIDFRKRDWVPHSGWPISFDDLEPYYHQASRLFRFPPLALFHHTTWMEMGRQGQTWPNWNQLQPKTFVAPLVPQNYGKEFLEIYQQKNIDLITDATVVRLEGNGDNGEVQQAIIKNRGSDTYMVKAKVFILACGGIENARLLLNSTFACPLGLGNDRDQVGRFFMNHPKNCYGYIIPRGTFPLQLTYFNATYLSQEVQGYQGLRIRETMQEQYQILNSYLRFEPVFAPSPVSSNSAFPKISKWSTKIARVILPHQRQFKSDPGINRPINSSTMSSTGPSSAGSPVITSINVRNFMEMEPQSENRVMLSTRKDMLGTSMAHVVHQLSELDKRSMAKIHQVLAQEPNRAFIGELHSALSADLAPWPIHYDASHHMGSTRMGSDPTTSVVNSDCRLHFSPNVYLAGSSVFPTSGNANPTYTLVALAIRLAGHLKARLATKGVSA